MITLTFDLKSCWYSLWVLSNKMKGDDFLRSSRDYRGTAAWWVFRIITVWLFIMFRFSRGLWNLIVEYLIPDRQSISVFENVWKAVFFFLLSTGTFPAVASPCTMTSGVTHCQMATNHSRSLQIPRNPQQRDVICEIGPGRSRRFDTCFHFDPTWAGLCFNTGPSGTPPPRRL